MLMPKRSKFRKQHRGRMQGEAHRGATLVFGEWGLQALEPVWLTSKQIEAARRAITHNTRRGGQVWIRVFPDKSVTAKPAETRMGSGKGGPDHWVAVVRPGHIIFEVGGIREELARQALTMAGHKLPIHTRILAREAETGGAAQEEPAREAAAPAAAGGDLA
jgi:large subunit ribosomal protein L16